MLESPLPPLFLERFQQLFPPGLYQGSRSTLFIKRPVTFRINPLKGSVSEVLSDLKQFGVSIRPVSWYEGAFITEIKDAQNLTSLSLFKEGRIYIQNLSSMIPPLVMDLKNGQKVLDLTAAPGSKTSEIAALLNNTGEIVANDKSHERLYKLRSVLSQQGVTNVTVSQKPGEILWKWHPEYFDSVLVDVPCSMEGRISTEDPESYKDWSLKKIKVLAQLQKKLLRSALSSAKIGGIVVYSTCTFSPEENEGVIDWLLQKEEGAVEVEKIALKGIEFLPGLTSWSGKKFDNSLENTRRIIPTTAMEGFYIAKLRKVKSTVPNLL